MEYLETIYSVLVILRMYCVGLAFIFYCRYQKKQQFNTLLGAIVYTFCGFVLYAGIRHPYFTNAVILLPLNFIAVEKLLKENRKIFLIFMVFVTAVSNYYFFYMITIMNVIYATIKYIVEYNKGIKDLFKKIVTAIVCYIVGLLMASIILLPTIYAFLNSARINYEQTYLYSPNFYKSLFMGLICMRFSNWTVISISAIILLMIPILYTKLKEKESKTYASLFFVTTIMLFIPVVASAMNGFSFPSNRWVFSYSFILSYIVTICFDERLQYSKKQIIIMAIFLLTYCIIGMYVTRLKIKSNLDFYICMVISICLLFIIVLSNTKERQLKWFKRLLNHTNIIVVFLIICNIWVVSFALYSQRGKGYVTEFVDNQSVTQLSDTLNGKMNHFQEAIEYIKANDNSFYRIAKCDS